MTLEASFTFFIAVLIFGITPGPGVFAILSKSLVYGSRACIPLALGMAMSDVGYLLAACLGLAALASQWTFAFELLRVVGAGYLIYLAWRMWVVQSNSESPQLESSNHLSGFTQGVLISFSNPKVILFYLAFLPAFMDLESLSAWDLVNASVITLCALMLGLMMIALAASRLRRALKSPFALRVMNRIAAGIMFAAGIFLLITVV